MVANSKARSAVAQGGRGQGAAAPSATNIVVLVGRLSGAPSMRVLPSGDELTAWRLVIDRDPAAVTRSSSPRAPSVDTIDCVAFKRGVQRLAARWASGDVIEARGALRRRFWRGAAGAAASRYEVEVSEARRLVAASAR